jgi:hypothetical protein
MFNYSSQEVSIVTKPIKIPVLKYYLSVDKERCKTRPWYEAESRLTAYRIDCLKNAIIRRGGRSCE